MKKSNNNKKTSPATYVAVSKNVYFDGSSYRTRVSVNGKKYSKNFPSKKKALEYKKQLLSA